MSLDLTGNDEQGNPWDFNLKEQREKAEKILDEQKLLLLIGTPMCTAFSNIQNLNKAKRDPEVVRREFVKACIHLNWCCHLYEKQMSRGAHFLHEHPAGATSWRETRIMELLQRQGVGRVVADQCQFGQETDSGDPLKKPTGFMSNAPELLDELNRRCFGRRGLCSRHRGGEHAECLGKKAQRAAIFKDELCIAILRGFKRQLISDRRMRNGEVGLTCDAEGIMLDGSDEVAAMAEACDWHALIASRPDRFMDDLAGLPLVPDLCRAARQKEIDYFEAKGVWEIRSEDEAIRRMGRRPISVRWVETNKGDDESPNVRSRLVAREIRLPGQEAIFAPTPPLESLRMILSMATTSFRGHAKQPNYDPESEQRTQILMVDISRAYFNAKSSDDDPIYVELPAEVGAPPGTCALLRRHMYGTRRAAEGWQNEYSTRLIEAGFIQGIASACVFHHEQRGIAVSVRGDDFTATGPKDQLDWFENRLNENYELTVGGRLGPGKADDKEARVLNRIIRWTDQGLEYEADPRQVEKLLEELELEGEGVKGVVTPGIKVDTRQDQNETELDADWHTFFRGMAARANFLAADRPDMIFAAKEICRFMAKPTNVALSALKRLGRYLKEHPRLVFKFHRQEADVINVHSDTDWAGCPRTRKSTSGGCLMVGNHVLKAWSST